MPEGVIIARKSHLLVYGAEEAVIDNSKSTSKAEVLKSNEKKVESGLGLVNSAVQTTSVIGATGSTILSTLLANFLGILFKFF